MTSQVVWIPERKHPLLDGIVAELHVGVELGDDIELPGVAGSAPFCRKGVPHGIVVEYVVRGQQGPTHKDHGPEIGHHEC